MRRLLSIGLSLLGLSLLAACSPAASTSSGPIKIGMVLPTTGSVALDGQAEAKGGQFAAKEINDAGGLNGRKVELIVEDGQCIPAPSTTAAEKLMTKDNVVALSGAFCSSATKAVIPLLDKYKVPMVNGVASDPTLTDPLKEWFFHTKIHNNTRAKYYVKFISEDLKLKNLAALAVNDDFGRSGVTAHSKVLDQYGGAFKTTQYFEHGETNFSSLLTPIKTSGVDGLFVVAEVQDGAMLMKQYHELGLKIPVVSIGSMNTPDFFKLAGANAEGVYSAEIWSDNVDTPEAKDFVARWKKAGNPDPGLYDVSGYVEVQTILLSMKAANSTEPAKIKEAMAKLDWKDSPIGQIQFDANHQAHTRMVISQNKNGKAVASGIVDTSK